MMYNMKLHMKDKYYTYLDDEDYQRIVKLLENDRADPAKWQLAYNNKGYERIYYASKTIGGRKGKKWKLHRLILQLRGIDIQGKEVDHKDRDGLNNRFSNLRIGTSSQNKQNQKLRNDSTTGYRGVYLTKNNGPRKYWAHIKPEGQPRKGLGMHKTAEDAAIAHNTAAIELYGPYARLNIVAKPKK